MISESSSFHMGMECCSRPQFGVCAMVAIVATVIVSNKLSEAINAVLSTVEN